MCEQRYYVNILMVIIVGFTIFIGLKLYDIVEKMFRRVHFLQMPSQKCCVF